MALTINARSLGKKANADHDRYPFNRRSNSTFFSFSLPLFLFFDRTRNNEVDRPIIRSCLYIGARSSINYPRFSRWHLNLAVIGYRSRKSLAPTPWDPARTESRGNIDSKGGPVVNVLRGPEERSRPTREAVQTVYHFASCRSRDIRAFDTHVASA